MLHVIPCADTHDERHKDIEVDDREVRRGPHMPEKDDEGACEADSSEHEGKELLHGGTPELVSKSSWIVPYGLWRQKPVTRRPGHPGATQLGDF